MTVNLPISDDQQEWLKLDNQLCFQIYSASKAMTRVYKPLLSKLKLTYPQYLAMLVLWEQHAQQHSQQQSGINVKQLGQKLHLDSGTLTPLLKRLELSGLIRRERSFEDERVVFIKLTTKGINLSTKASDIPEVLLCRLKTPLDELLTLKTGLEKLIGEIQPDEI